jgi:predicted transcriptional regulator
MAMKIDIKVGYQVQEVSSIIKSALIRDAHIASYKKKKYMGVCKRFEKKYGMSSDEFMDKWESGMLDDRDNYFDWYAAKKGMDIWNKRLRILAGVNI